MTGSVLDPGSGAFLTPGSGIGFFPDPGSIFKSLVSRFWVKSTIILSELAFSYFFTC